MQRNLVVFGLGISATALLNFAKQKDDLNVIASDDNKARIDELKKQFKDVDNISFATIDDINFDKIDLIICAPGISEKNKIFQIANLKKIKITCDIELMQQFCQDSKFIGITGTNGKSTISALTNHILTENNIKSQLGGNIGNAVFNLNLDGKNSNFVLEVSSFQLDLIEETYFNISVISNITPDHLDRHGNMENYIAAKKRVFLNSHENDFLILNIDDENCLKIYQELKDVNIKLITVSVKNDLVKINFDDQVLENNLKNSDYLQGKHNLYNIAIAYVIGKIFDLKNQNIYDAIASFKGLKHRLQLVSQDSNIAFINDSKATNATSCVVALKSFDNIYLILGGVAKDGGIKEIIPHLDKVKHVFLIGQASDQFAQGLEGRVEYFKCQNLENAFNKATKIAENDPNLVNILLSPACSSFDQWPNFEKRGEFFCQLVTNYVKK